MRGTSARLALLFEGAGGTSEPGPPLQLRNLSSVHGATPNKWRYLLLATKLPHAADECDEGLQRTSGLERRQQSCVACRFLLEVSYHTSCCSNNRASTWYHTSNKHHDDDDSPKTNADDAAVDAAVVVAAGAPSPQTNEPRLTYETGGNGYGASEIKHFLHLYLGIVDTSGPIYYYSFFYQVCT